MPIRVGQLRAALHQQTAVCAAVSLVVFMALGCDGSPEAIPTQAAEQSVQTSYLTPRYLSEAINALLGPLPKPVRLLSLTALNRVVVLQVQNSKDPRSVVEYRYQNGNVTGPVPVELKGPGKLVDNLFRIDALDLHIAEKVLNQVRSEYAEEVRKLILTRNLPTSMDIQFRVFLKTNAGDRIIVADKTGRLLGPLTTSSAPTNSPTSP
jgi:hypothetical protein